MTSRQQFLVTIFTVCVHIALTSSATVSDSTDTPKKEKDEKYKLHVFVDSSNVTTDREFLSLMFGSSVFRRSENYNCDLTTQKMVNMGLELYPATLRLGGTASHDLLFDPEGTVDEKTLRDGMFTMTGEEWDTMTNYSRNVGWNLVWDFNLFFWTDENRTAWDPTNAKLLLDYSAARKVPIPYFQLGNEVSSYNFKFGFRVTPAELIQHFKTLRTVLAEYPDYKDSKLVGPDLGNIFRSRGHRDYMDEFMQEGGGDAVDIIGQHQYYADSDLATVETFLNPDVMDGLEGTMDVADEIIFSVKPDIPFWFSETSSCWGGGAPDISNSYVAGFLWLDKLGVSALRGVQRVMRQIYCGSAYYALIDTNLQPYPDYFLSVLYKRLIEGAVFSVKVEPRNPALRVYAHCARQDVYGYPPGSIAVYYLNTQNTSMTLKMTRYAKFDLDLFQLTSSNVSDMTSKYVDLNGETIVMQGDDLPPLNPKNHSGDVILQAQSFGFIIVKDAQVPLCGWVPTTMQTTTTVNITTPDRNMTSTAPSNITTTEKSDTTTIFSINKAQSFLYNSRSQMITMLCVFCLLNLYNFLLRT